MARAVGLRTFSFSTLQLDKSSETADSEKSLRGIPIAVLGFPWPLWKPAIRESRVARLEAALVFSKPFAEELVDFFRVAAWFLAAFTCRGLCLAFWARLFLNTFPVPFFFKLSKVVVDFFDRPTCFLDFCIFPGVLAAFIFLVLLLERLFFSADVAASCTLLEEGLLEFSIFSVQGAASKTSVLFKGQSWNPH